MRHIIHKVKKHKYKIIACNGIVVAFFLTASLIASDESILFFSTSSEQVVYSNDTVDVDVAINSKVRIDAVGAVVLFPPEQLEIVSISKKKSFLDLWTEDVIVSEKEGKIIFSGGITAVEGHIGTGTILTMTVRGKAPGNAHLSFEDFTVYPHDGSGIAVPTKIRTLTYTIEKPEPKSSTPGIASSPNPSVASLKADLNSDGKISLADVSVMMFSLFGAYRAGHDLNTDGELTLADLSILLSYF